MFVGELVDGSWGAGNWLLDDSPERVQARRMILVGSQAERGLFRRSLPRSASSFSPVALTTSTPNVAVVRV